MALSAMTRKGKRARVVVRASSSTDDAPASLDDLPAIDTQGAVIVGRGRVGDALTRMGRGYDVVVKRGDPWPENAPEGPIYICTRNDALKGVIDMIPKERHEDIVLIQNGALLPFVERELGKDLPITILLVYFAVAKFGEDPTDGITDLDPDGLTAVNATGKWATEVEDRLLTSRLSCRMLNANSFMQAYWEKNLWIAAYMLVGALHKCTVGEVVANHREEVDNLICELASAVSATNPDVRWGRAQLCDRLAAYARSVAHFPTAVKEFEWRNGPFYAITEMALAAGRDDPCPLHTAGLKEVGALPAPA